MARQRSSLEDLFTKSVGVAFAVGALAAGVAAALMNQERARQVRAEVQTQLDNLSKRVDDLSAQAAQMIQERRPDIEETIAKSRQAVFEGLEKARNVVEQGAERAQEYVQKASQKAAGTTEQAGETASTTVQDAADQVVEPPADYSAGSETRDLNLNNNGSGGGPQ